MGIFNRSFGKVWRALMLGLCLAAGFGQPAAAGEVEDIYLFVAGEMAVEKVPAPPRVYFVNRDTLQAAFQANNQAAFVRWETQYGEDEARLIMGRYMKGVVGLFVSRSGTVYVDASLSPCRQGAVLAHEFCHFFQYVMEGEIGQDQYRADILHLIRELKAYKLEHLYMETYCIAP